MRKRTRPDDPAGAYARTEFELGSEGLTKREMFALYITAAHFANPVLLQRGAEAAASQGVELSEAVAHASVASADALISALNEA